MIEVYDALALKEPWLELILLELKTLETRTKLMRKKSGAVVLCSSKEVDVDAWTNPKVGGLLDAAAKARALAGVGKTRALVDMSGFRPGVPGVEDERARIGILLPDGSVRFVSEVANPRRLVEYPTMRIQEREGEESRVVPGASQGFFRMPASMVRLAA